MILHSDHAASTPVGNTVRCSLSMDPFDRAWDAHIAVLTMRGWKVFATLKKELVYRLHCVSMKRDQVRQMIFRWIETYYNPLRRNTANEDHLPPLVKRRRWLSAQAQVHNRACWVCGFLDYSMRDTNSPAFGGSTCSNRTLQQEDG